MNNDKVTQSMSFKCEQSTDLHTIVDASEDAYSAVTYIRHESKHEVIVKTGIDSCST